MKPATDPYPDIFEELVRLRRSGRGAVLATVVAVRGSAPQRVGAHMLVAEDGSVRGTIGGGVREADAVRAALELMRKGGARKLELDYGEETPGGDGPQCGGAMEVFMQRVDPPRRVVIAGAGHVGYFLHRFVSLLEMGSVVFDERPEFASAERFPGAALHVRPFEGGLRELRIGGNDAVVVITPEHKYDREVLGQALETDAGYIGMIGSKRKIKAIFDNLRAAGVSDERLAQVHSPIGLDIGAESPAEIALAIAAQIVDHFKRAG